jgi:DNA repair exonuclease SbcCD ATPase subunit
MIVFKELSWRNFLSTGNVPTVIRLNTSPTTLILGYNGSGKSTFLDAICYALFKKPFRKIKKDQIVNTINGSDCEVRIDFSIGTHDYTVRRGIKPDFFEIIMPDGEPRKKAAGAKDDQAFLEEDILKVNYESFTQVVILGNAAYTPFMQLKAAQRREFIEHILDIGVFSSMNEILKKKQTTVTTSLATLNKDIDLQKEKLTLVKGFIDKLEADRKKANKNIIAQMAEQNAIIDELEPVADNLQKEITALHEQLQSKTKELNAASVKEIDALTDQMEDSLDALREKIVDTSAIENRLRTMSPLRTGILNNIKNTKASILFYEDNDSCKTCKQGIEQQFRSNIIEQKQKQIEEYEVGLAKLDKEVEKQQARLTELNESNRKLEEQISKAQSAHQVTVRKMMHENTANIAEMTAELQADLKFLNAKHSTHSATLSGARQLVKKMEADKKAAESSKNIDEQYKKRDEIVEKADKLESTKADAIETRHFYEIAAVLLKDSGIKAAIIKQYLPMINKLVNKYLVELDFYLLFALDENFDETFKSRHRDTLQYYSFSEGEKLRIDLALLFCWRDIARMKNSCACNLLILDEVIDGSMDHNGTDFFIKLINELGTGSNVFVISHKQDSSLDKFKDVLRFEKVKNFSQLAVNL